MWSEAFEALSRVVSGETGDDIGTHQIAELHAAICLFQLRRFPEAAATFRAIATNPSHREQGGSLPWLVKLAAEDPSLVEVKDFALFPRERAFRLDGPGEAEFAPGAAYFIGLHRLAVGHRDDARELFARVPDDHPYGASARRCFERAQTER